MVNDTASNPTGPVSPELLAALLTRHAAALVLYARQLCDCPDDCVQESLIELAGQPHLPDDVVAWLYRVVRNRAISAARAATRRRRREQVAAAQRGAWFAAAADDDRPDPRAVTEALAALPVADRELVVTRVWGGLTFQQIATLLGVSDSTAQRRYAAALAALRERLNTPCPKND